jgi:acyl carrier protein
MQKEAVIEKLKSVMQQSSSVDIDWNSLAPETTIESLGFDSLTILDLIYDIQQVFGLDFDAEDLVNVKTVEELAEFLQANKPA